VQAARQPQRLRPDGFGDGAYLLPGVQAHADGSFTVVYTLSSFDPYNVALFTTTFTP
jgi:hypothetical protein